MPDRLTSLRRALDAHGQTHVLAFSDELSPEDRTALLEQIRSIDLAAVADLLRSHRHRRTALPEGLEPAPFYPRADATPAEGAAAPPYDAARYRAIGERLVTDGKVAAFTVAGGQGTRLGWNGPKGTYPATPVTGKPLFRLLAEQIMAAQKKYRVTIPWYLMTSPENDAPTRAFFLDNNCFGLTRSNVFMFPQGTMPSVDGASGRLLLAGPGEIAVSPDGHGGAIKALAGSGALEDMRDRGVEQISYFQVDNPLVRVIDPLFLGLHAAAPDSSGEMSSKMVGKTDPEEKLGVLARAGGRTMVIEYSELPDELARARDDAGALRFCAGSIAVHLLAAAFVERLTGSEERMALPYHCALKKVAHLDPESGRRVEPEEPNAIKFETFVFDALPRAASSIVYEVGRVEEFAPIKNARGADSPATSHALQTARAARWLEAHGVHVPRDGAGEVAARIEIGPLTATEPADLVAVDLPAEIVPGQELAL